MEGTGLYIVEFRSRLQNGIDVDLLSTLDIESHIEVTKGWGLLKYWFRRPEVTGHNLATCDSYSSCAGRHILVVARISGEVVVKKVLGVFGRKTAYLVRD